MHDRKSARLKITLKDTMGICCLCCTLWYVVGTLLVCSGMLVVCFGTLVAHFGVLEWYALVCHTATMADTATMAGTSSGVRHFRGGVGC